VAGTAPPSPDTTRLLATARVLYLSARTGTPQPLLRGKHVALLGPVDAADAGLFVEAAAALGAQVSRVDASALGEADDAALQRLARAFGHLYDAVECQALPAPVVRRLAALVTVPVLDGIGSARHPSAALATLVAGDATPAEARRALVQAQLLAAIG